MVRIGGESLIDCAQGRFKKKTYFREDDDASDASPIINADCNVTF